jgi:antitoxin VapB
MAQTPPLNIKDPEAYRLAAEIAARSGKSLTRVVVDALRREAQQYPQPVDRSQVRTRLARLHAFPLVADHDPAGDLYDDRGLPR